MAVPILLHLNNAYTNDGVSGPTFTNSGGSFDGSIVLLGSHSWDGDTGSPRIVAGSSTTLAGDFTVLFAYYKQGSAGTLFGFGDQNVDQAWHVEVFTSTIYVVMETGGGAHTDLIAVNHDLTDNAWNWICVQRQGSTVSLATCAAGGNFSVKGTGSWSAQLAGALSINDQLVSGSWASYPLAGHYDEIYIDDAAAKYATLGGSAAPTAELSAGGGAPAPQQQPMVRPLVMRLRNKQFRPRLPRSELSLLPLPAPITATLSVTDDADTLSSTAAVTVAATLSATDATDTLSSAAAVLVAASLSLTDATDTLSSTAAVTVTASLSATDDADTLSSAAAVTVVTALSLTDATDTLSSAAAVLVTVNLSVTDDADTLSSSAIVGNPPVDVTLNVTDDADTLAATSTSVVNATLAQTDAQDALSSAAAVLVVAALAVTDGTDTLDASATTAGPVTCTLDVTDQADTLSSQVHPESDVSGHGGRNAGPRPLDFRLYDVLDMRERIAVLNVTDDNDTVQATARRSWVERVVGARLTDDDDGCAASAVVVPWPALELMREHRLEAWHPRTMRGRRALLHDESE